MTGHSADVRIALLLDGAMLPASHLGPDFIVLKNPADHPPSRAEILVAIDGEEQRWSVQLVDGVSREQLKIRISAPRLP